MSIALIAALPREIAGLVRGKEADSQLKKQGIALYRFGSAVVAAGGMGSNRVTLAVQAALSASEIKTLISVGLAGSCQPSVKAGSLLHATSVVDARTGERFQASGSTEPTVLVSTQQIASAQEKARLHSAYGAAMVDMEAATVARLAQAHGLAFQAVKGISDAHDFEIESLSRFADSQGQFQTLRFAAYTAMRPQTWRAAVQLARYSSTALKMLESRLLAVINKQ